MPALGGLALAEVLFWVGALIFCYLCVYIAKALLGTTGSAVGWIPGVGGWLKTGIHTVERKIVSVMSDAALRCDAKMGAAIHDLARLTDWVGREIKSHAGILAVLAQVIAGGVPWTTFYDEIHRLLHRAKAGEQALRGIGADIIPRIKVIERGIGADVKPEIRSLDKELARVEAKTIPAIEAKVGELEHGATDLWTWIRRHPASVASAAFVGAVAWAIARLGMSWTRCENWKKVGRGVCGMPQNLLNDLLGLIADFFIVRTICEVVPQLEDAFSVVAVPMVDAITTAGLAVCSGPRQRSAPLAAPSVHLPASAGVTTYLP